MSKAAELLQEKLGVSSDRQPKQPEKRRRHDGRTSQEKLSPTANLPTIVNAPLDFVLKHLDPAHPYLSQRGFTPETIREFGLALNRHGHTEDQGLFTFLHIPA